MNVILFLVEHSSFIQLKKEKIRSEIVLKNQCHRKAIERRCKGNKHNIYSFLQIQKVFIYDTVDIKATVHELVFIIQTFQT